MPAGKKIYILGICGTFTAQVAKLAIDLGNQVYGCDNAIYPPMSEVLKKLKIKVDIRYKLSHLKKNQYDYFIVGNAISRGNPILEHILEHKLPFVSASRWIKENVLSNQKVVAVSGTHGKTTTTAMIVHLLKSNQIECGYLIAGNAIGLKSNAALAKDGIFVIEADEYDSAFSEKYPKFMHYQPDILLINNLEFDHGDIYDNLKQIQIHFHYLIRTLRKNAELILPKSNQAIEAVLKLGFYSKKSYWQLSNQTTQPKTNQLKKNQLVAWAENDSYQSLWFGWFAMLDGKQKIQTKTLTWQNPNLASKHNSENALSAVMTGLKLGLNLSQSIKALESFKGVERRMELKFESEKLKLFDDFAHHPTAIQSSLEALKNNYPNHKILALFDPSSNTMKSGIHPSQTLAQSFQAADFLYIYQPKNALIDCGKIAQIFQSTFNQEAKSFDGTELIAKEVIHNIKKFDIIILLSNGSFNQLSEKLIESINAISI